MPILKSIQQHWKSITIFLLLVITFLSLYPLPELPEFPGTDKTHHFVAYFILAFPSGLRIPKKSSENRYSQYVDLTTLCQNIIYTAMKTKQTVDLLHLEELRILIDDLVKLYFDEHGIEHLKQLRE